MKYIPFALAFATLPSLVQAHPGPHDDIDTLPDALSHVLGSPDHASWLILAVTAVLATLAVKAAIRIVGGKKSDGSH